MLGLGRTSGWSTGSAREWEKAAPLAALSLGGRQSARVWKAGWGEAGLFFRFVTKGLTSAGRLLGTLLLGMVWGAPCRSVAAPAPGLDCSGISAGFLSLRGRLETGAEWVATGLP